MSELLRVLVGALIWAVFLPLASPFIFCLFVYRQLVNLIVRLSDPSLEPLGYVDHALAFGSSEKEVQFMLTGALRIEGTLDILELRQHFRKTYLDIEKPQDVFYQYLVTCMGYVFRKRVDNIDLEFHIREVYVEDVVRDFDKVLNHSVEDNDHLRGGVPPWEMVLLQNPAREASVLIVKIHHGLADGCAFNYLLDQFTGNRSPYIVKDYQDSLPLKILTFLKGPVNLLEMYRAVRPLKAHPFGIKSGHCRKKFFTSTTSVELEVVKSIRKETGSRIIPILLAANFQALKASLTKLGKIPETTTFNKLYRSNYLLPIPSHPAILEAKIQNHCVTGGVLIRMEEVDSVKRLEEVDKSFMDFLNKGNDRILGWSSRLSYLMPNRFIKASVQKSFQQICHSSVLTTMMLSPDKYYLMGKPVSHINGLMSPYSSLQFEGILVSIFSAGETLDICVRATTELFETQDQLDFHVKKILPEQFRSLKESCERKARVLDFQEV